MSEYTPTTDQVRAVFVAAPGHRTRAGSRHEAFERWLASVTTPTPTDDEREVFEAIADRLGEHPQAANYEIADSGEYETKLRGPIDVELLAEWLTPTVRAALRAAGGAR